MRELTGRVAVGCGGDGLGARRCVIVWHGLIRGLSLLSGFGYDDIKGGYGFPCVLLPCFPTLLHRNPGVQTTRRMLGRFIYFSVSSQLDNIAFRAMLYFLALCYCVLGLRGQRSVFILYNIFLSVTGLKASALCLACLGRW